MELNIKNLVKSYGNLPVLNQVNLCLHSGPVYCLMGASGSGKTTLLRIIMGLEQADQGHIRGAENCRISAVFQEDRLCESFSPLENIRIVTGRSLSRQKAAEELCRLLPEESITRPVSTLSGGMKRRTAICRALLSPSDLVLMDEPFTGLDETTKKLVIKYIKEKTRGKLVLITTHQEEDIALLNGTLITLNPPPC